MRLIPISAQQAQSYQMGQGAPQAALQQPGASLANTQQSTATSAQSASTSATEQQNLTAQNPGLQAESGIKQVQQQQINYPLLLKDDLSQGTTLKSAINKYSSLMKPDDIFKQYLSESPYGMPHETPTELQNMGISSDALGKIGEPSSFIDRWNTKNAIAELRGLKDTWDQTDAVSHLPFLSAGDASARAYNAQKQVVGEHLSSLVPGASNSQGSNQGFLDTLPGAGDPFAEGAAAGQFNKIEQALLQSKGYSYQDLGLASPKTSAATPDKKQSGGGVLNFLLGSAMNTAQDVGTGIRSKMEQPNLQKSSAMASNLEQEAQSSEPSLKKILLGEANQIRTSTGNEAGDIGKSFSPDVNQNPLLRGILGGAQIASTAEIPAAIGGAAKLATTGATSALDFLNPARTIPRSGAVRDAIVNSATKAGSTIDGNTLFSDIQKWATTAKRGNLGQGGAIDQAVQDAEQVFKDQKITPQEAASIYREADSGFTRTGIPKTPIQSNIDRGLRNILSSHLEESAPGWKQATGDMAGAYQAVKSPVRQGVKNLAKYGIPLIGGGAGADLLTHLLFGGK